MKPVHFIIPIIAFFLCSMSATAQKMESKEKQISLRDPHAYNTAEEMLKCAETLPHAEEVDIILEFITSNINNGMLIENEKIWKLLMELEPYRMTEQVQTAVGVWIDKTLENIAEKQKEKMVPVSNMRSMSTAYKEKDFNKTVSIARTLLLDIPNTLDARNNMALALMHLNYDLCAQIELEIIRNMSDDYIPGLINLTVLSERMDKGIYAKKIAKGLLNSTKGKSSDNQLIRFNAAWYLNEEGNYTEANSVLINTKDPANNNVKKYADLKEINRKQLKEAQKKK